jgi:hypothetical protein
VVASSAILQSQTSSVAVTGFSKPLSIFRQRIRHCCRNLDVDCSIVKKAHIPWAASHCCFTRQEGAIGGSSFCNSREGCPTLRTYRRWGEEETDQNLNLSMICKPRITSTVNSRDNFRRGVSIGVACEAPYHCRKKPLITYGRT